MFKEWLLKNKPNQKKLGEGHRYYRTALAI